MLDGTQSILRIFKLQFAVNMLILTILLIMAVMTCVAMAKAVNANENDMFGGLN